MDLDRTLRELAPAAASRMDLWPRIADVAGARAVAEIGVYRGDFAARMLEACPGVETYWMIDPWRHLDDWNKPANKSDETFERYLAETLEKTAAHERSRRVLRGRTSEVVGEIPDGSLDFAYVDGDHTLRGITVDLVKVWPKVRPGGLLGGDDFCRSIWQHRRTFEPTLVFPFAVYFAEAVDARIYALPHNQFLIEKDAEGGHAFVDLTGRYGAADLRSQLAHAAEPAPERRPSIAARVRRRLR